MEQNQSELTYEQNRLEQTISLANKQLEKARNHNEDTKAAILEAKKELRENTSHSIVNLWSSDSFEALAALNQYADPISDKIIDYEEVENKIALLETLIKSPYFARIDFKFDGEDDFEEIYIGRSSLKKDNKFELQIYDWRSPIASVFYRFVNGQAYYDAPGGRINGEVNLKRQYEIKDGELEYFFDADVQIVDEFLRKLLSGNTSSKMKTIIETIQKEQDIIIRDMENELMMVQGVAGSGKTSIALHRAAYLMYQGLSAKLSASNIMIVSPNNLFEQYISNVLPELGESNVVSVVFEDIISKSLKSRQIQTRNEFLENLISSSGYRDIIKSSMEFKTSYQFIEIINRFIDDLPHRWIDIEDVYYDGQCVASKQLLKKKILSGRDVTSLGLKLRLMEDYVLELIRETKKRKLKDTEENEIKEKVRAFTRLNTRALYRKLFRNKKYFYSLAEGLELPDCIEDILTYTKENLEGFMLYYDDASALTYMNLKINGTSKYKEIKQVVIDEAQDYYPLHFKIFNLLFPTSKFTVLGDINQTLEKQENLSLYEQIKDILGKKNSSLVTLDKSFRCTNEILNYGLHFLDQQAEIKSFNREGEAPKVCRTADQYAFNKAIICEVDSCQNKGYESIGLICKTEKNARYLYEQLKDEIDVQLVSSKTTTDLHGVFIIPVYMSKGLEFDAVLICDADEQNYHTGDDKKLLYISCTRALHRLNLFCKGTPSSLLPRR